MVACYPWSLSRESLKNFSEWHFRRPNCVNFAS
jgi:hypothetical protein